MAANPRMVSKNIQVTWDSVVFNVTAGTIVDIPAGKSRSRKRGLIPHRVAKSLEPLLYVTPATLLFCVLMLVPMITVTWYSLLAGAIVKKTPSFVLFHAAPSLLGRSLQGVLDTLKQLISTKWLWKKIDRARFHCLRAHWDVAVASDKDELFFTAALNQCFLQIHPVDSRHLHIHDHARRAAVWWTGQEIGSRRENFAFVPSSP